MTRYSRDLDPHRQIEVSVEQDTGDVTLLYGMDRECVLDANQASDLLSFLLSYQAAIRLGQKRAQETEHAESFWYTNTFKPSQDCGCPVCRYIRCDDGDEEFAVNFPGVHLLAFEQRMIELDLHFSC